MIKRIAVTYHFALAPEHRETVERVLRIHQDQCPVARTLRGCVAITTTLAED